MMKIYCIISLALIFSMYSCKNNSTGPVLTDPPVPYTQIDFEPSISSDGLKMLYVHNDLDFDRSGIYSVNFTNNIDSQFISGLSRSPDWSPHSKWIVYTRDNFMFKIKSNGDSQTVLVSGGNNFFPKWSNDGNKITYTNTECGGSIDCGVWIVNKDGSGKALIENNAYYSEWIDNGNTLIYLKPARDNGGNSLGDSLFQFSLSNNSRTLITVLSGDDHKFNYYLNYASGEIIFCSTSKAGLTYIFKRNNSGSILKLTNSQGWSPDYSVALNKIVYTNRDAGEGKIWIMNTDGSNQQELGY